jgi:hypothetical protein
LPGILALFFNYIKTALPGNSRFWMQAGVEHACKKEVFNGKPQMGNPCISFFLSLQVGKSYRGIGRKAALNLDGSAPRL